MKRDCLLQEKRRPAGERQPIREFSQRSIDRMAFTIACSPVRFASMITLTYPHNFPTDGKRIKVDLNRMLQRIGRVFGAHSYFWFLEFQRRGAPHYHILSTLPAPDQEGRDKLAYSWVNQVGPDGEDYQKMLDVHRHKKAWEAIRKRRGGARYALWYASKKQQKTCPANFRDVGRFWGCSRDVKPQPIATDVSVTEDELRQWLADRGYKQKDWGWLPKFIWSDI